jgi:hypothetical protein
MVYGSAPQKIHYGIQEGWDGASKKEPHLCIAQPLNAGDFRARKEKKSQNFIHVNKFELRDIFHEVLCGELRPITRNLSFFPDGEQLTPLS